MHFFYLLSTLFAVLISSAQAAPFQFSTATSPSGVTKRSLAAPSSTGSLFPREILNPVFQERQFEGARNPTLLTSRSENAPFPRRNETIEMRAVGTAAVTARGLVARAGVPIATGV